MRLRLCSLEEDLAHQFSISIATVSRICTTWIRVLNNQLRPLIPWPSRASTDLHMPTQFKEQYPCTRVIIDCTEIYTETPSSLPIQSATFSSYKLHNTFKGLVGISPTGAVIFISDLYTGSGSDKELTNYLCGILNLVEPGDSVMADKGFDIAYDVMLKGAKLNIPPFASRNQQMSKKKVICTRKIASLRIHVEGAIGRIKQYRILCTDVPLTLHNIIIAIFGVYVVH